MINVSQRRIYAGKYEKYNGSICTMYISRNFILGWGTTGEYIKADLGDKVVIIGFFASLVFAGIIFENNK